MCKINGDFLACLCSSSLWKCGERERERWRERCVWAQSAAQSAPPCRKGLAAAKWAADSVVFAPPRKRKIRRRSSLFPSDSRSRRRSCLLFSFLPPQSFNSRDNYHLFNGGPQCSRGRRWTDLTHLILSKRRLSITWLLCLNLKPWNVLVN